MLAQIILFDGSASDVPSAPSGWTAIRHDAISDVDQETSWLYYKVAGSNEPGFYQWNIGANWATGVIGDWRGASAAPIGNASGATGAGASPISVYAPSLTPANSNELQLYFYAGQAASAPTLTMSNSLTQLFNQRSSKEGFTLGFAQLGAPSVGVPSSVFPATATISGGTALTAQAVLLVASSQSTLPVAPPQPTATATPISSGGGSITFVGASPLTDSSGELTTVSVAVPSGVHSGDVMLAQIVVYDGTGSDAPIAPSGWSAIRHDSISSGNQLTSWLYYKIASSTEPALYGWNIGANWAAGAMGDWRGAVSPPLDVASGITKAGTSPVSATAPSLTPSNNGELQVCFYAAQAFAAPTLTLSSSLNRRFEVGSSKEGFALGFGDIGAPGAGTATGAYPASASISGSVALTAQTILLH
jgi:hypothetical protein